jgi:hypothetical protein
MLTSTLPILLAGAQLANAHFGLTYPPWRADTLSEESEEIGYSQWVWPCANVSENAGERTDWPVAGGAIELELHHEWTYLYINLGLGNNVTNFNITLTPQLLNVTGEGNYCIPSLGLPEGLVTDGQNASIQVVTNGDSGSALYNCADITLRTNAPSHECTNSTGISAVIVGQTESEPANETASPPPSAAAGIAVNSITLSALVGLAIACVAGMGL